MVVRRKWEDAPLAGGLEEEPLQLVDLLFDALDRDLALRVVLVNEVSQDRVRFPTRPLGHPLIPSRVPGAKHVPNDEIIVVMVDKRRNAAVRVVLCVLWRLLLALLEVEVDGLVLQTELL